MLTNIIIPHGIANLHDASEFMEFVKLRFAKGRVAPDSQFVHLTITKPHKEGTNEMSSNSQETIVDIVADIRAQNQGLPEDSYALSPQVCDLLSFSDRIEAAHQREVGELCGERNGILNANASLADDNDRLRREVAELERKVSELRECLKEAVTEVCNRLEKCGFKEPCVFKTCYVQKWRKALKGSSND